MNFLRIVDNKLYNLGSVKELGFSIKTPMYIPDEYLEKQEFVIMRSCFGIGDWGIISNFPKKIKQKYPNSKVYIPSKKLLESIFGKRELFNNTYDTVLSLFDNNPYVDGKIDSVQGDIFHDHYRIYDDENINEPLLKQILRFWKIDDHTDLQPSLYFSKEEIELGNKIIKEHVGNNDFGCLLLSNRFGTQKGKFDDKTYKHDVHSIKKLLNEHKYPYFYWSYIPINETEFDFINKALDMRHISLRIQLYIKTKAKINIGNQCGTSEIIPRYSKVYESQRQFPIKSNFVEGIIYV